jgi:hypothetical protein
MGIVRRHRGTRATPAGSSATVTVVPDADVNLTPAAEEWFKERGVDPKKLSRDQKLAVQAPWEPGDPVRGATYTMGLLPSSPKDVAEDRTEKELQLGL